MKGFCAVLLRGLLGITAFSQKNTNTDHTLLWKISGNGLKKPSYLFGTIHMLCEDDAVLSDSLKNVIRNVKEVYFEVDLDNMFELLGVMSKMTMQGDTTLQDLLSESDYEKVKSYFDPIRYHVDKLEQLVDDAMWPLPKFRELLFIK